MMEEGILYKPLNTIEEEKNEICITRIACKVEEGILCKTLNTMEEKKEEIGILNTMEEENEEIATLNTMEKEKDEICITRIACKVEEGILCKTLNTMEEKKEEIGILNTMEEENEEIATLNTMEKEKDEICITRVACMMEEGILCKTLNTMEEQKVEIETFNTMEEEIKTLNAMEEDKEEIDTMQVIEKIPQLRKQIRLLSSDYWSNDDTDDCYRLIDVPRDSIEFQQIKNAVLSTSRNLRGNQKITSILNLRRIENPFLLGQYLLKREKTGGFEEKLFHGTVSSNLLSICKNNFNWRLSGQSRGHRYGRGISFSPLSCYATCFGNTLIMSKVLYKNKIEGDSSVTIPREPYDTTVGRKERGIPAVWVKYHDDDFYPEYVMDYI